MSRMSRAFRCSLLGVVLIPASTSAAPNVFWTFGFDRHYAHGSGGRAALPAKIMLAARSTTSPTDTVMRVASTVVGQPAASAPYTSGDDRD